MTAAQQVMPQVGHKPVLDALGLSRATFYRRRQVRATPPPRPPSPRALTQAERESILEAMNSERFVDTSPAEVVVTLAEEGCHLGSERTIYRVLAANQQVRERRAQRRHPAYARPELVATGPNQVWSWDITKLMTFCKFRYLFLYVILDIYSRYVVGWMVAEHENAGLARTLIGETCARHGVQPNVLTLHSDRGSPMRSKTLAQLLAGLDVTASFGRPQVSNDNPYSESFFKTAKYSPGFPSKFSGLPEADQVCAPLFKWYNTEHHHSGIVHLTPAQLHFGRAQQALDARHNTAMQAYLRHPERFVHGPPSCLEVPQAVYINPPRKETLPPAPLKRQTHRHSFFQTRVSNSLTGSASIGFIAAGEKSAAKHTWRRWQGRCGQTTR